MQYKGLWITMIVVIAASFGVLGYFGYQIYREKPPIPATVATPDGTVLFTGQDIRDGQSVWQSIGGHELGSIWGHGSYVAPDWSADWLHREATWTLEYWATTEHGSEFATLDDATQAELRERLIKMYRTNTYDAATDTIAVPPVRALAMQAMGEYYAALFGDAEVFGDSMKALSDGGMTPIELREHYAMPANTIKDAERQRMMNAFFWWTAWACAAERPQDATAAAITAGEARSMPTRPISYTNNWPAESLVGNRPTGTIILWSVISFVLLLAGIAALAWYYAVQKHRADDTYEPPANDPLINLSPTPSMRATLKYFWVVVALAVVQIILGAITAHYAVEGQGFYGIPLAKILPYSVVRTWHTQLGIFWIATAWLATGLFVAPAISGHEPKYQRLGVNILFSALLVIVLGSMFGTWLGTRQDISLKLNYWFGHQGWEYVDLGRFWQIFLFAGLFIWLGLMARALMPAFKQKQNEQKSLLALFFVSILAIALFYGAGLMWGRQSHLAMVEYWRWWVVHLWVEGFFEVFATVVIAFLFTRMGLLRVRTATTAVLFATSIFLSGGIIGTFHHLYFTGTPTPVLALGAAFSALEVVPLVLMGFEAYENLTLTRAKPWVQQYKWPIYFFVAVAFWNLVGAGLFGFLINPPIALYYMQGLNTTPVHGHTALFGVYGMLGLGLLLFCLKGLSGQRLWKTKVLSWSFWAINIGLMLMVLISVLPVGLAQTWASVEHGFWYARSAEYLRSPGLDTLRWMRVFGDTIFALGIIGLAWFVLGLKTGWSLREEDAE